MDASMTETTALLQVERLSRRYGGRLAVQGISFDVPKGSITALIGPNGAGKTTTLNLISGLVTPTSGRVLLEGENLSGRRPDQGCVGRMARTFQTPQVFRSMSVRNNLFVGTTARGRINLLETAISTPRVR